MNTKPLVSASRTSTAALISFASIFAIATHGEAAPMQPSFKFDFGSGAVAPGYTQILPTTAYSAERGYGFENTTDTVALTSRTDVLRGGAVTSNKPFYFSVRVPEGNYNVSLILGDQTAATTTTVKAEARRLMLEKVQTKAGEFVTRNFTVAIKKPELLVGGKVRLKADENNHRDWDDVLTLEFNDARPVVCAVEITPVENALTVFLAGDSTVTNQKAEPWSAWGQMLPRFFKPGVAVANHAQSGETLSSFTGARRLQKILETIRPGDYLFIQFGHNDQKDTAAGSGPFTSYKTNLKRYVAEARGKGAIPVLVTSVERRRFKGGAAYATLTDYAEAVRQVGKEETVPVIDLNAESLKLYQILGSVNSKKAFVHYPAGTFPGQDKDFKDDTHFSNYGAYQLVKIVVDGIKKEVPALAKSLADDIPAYDLTRPDAPETWNFPASVTEIKAKPEGS